MSYDSTKWQTNLRLILKKLITTGIIIKGKRLEFHKGTVWEYVDEVDLYDGYSTINTYDKGSRLTLNEFFHYVSDISDDFAETAALQGDKEDPFLGFVNWADEVFYFLLDLVRKYEPDLEGEKDFIQKGYGYADEIKKDIP